MWVNNRVWSSRQFLVSTPAAATVLNVVAAGLLIWSLWAVATRFMPTGERAATHDGPSARVVKRPIDAYRVEDIVAAHLFGDAQQAVVRPAATLPQTRLNVNLLGIMASDDARLARAIVSVNSARSGVFSIGETLAGTDATIFEIRKDAVIIDRGGQLEQLAMPRDRRRGGLPDEDRADLLAPSAEPELSEPELSVPEPLEPEQLEPDQPEQGSDTAPAGQDTAPESQQGSGADPAAAPNLPSVEEVDKQQRLRALPYHSS